MSDSKPNDLGNVSKMWDVINLRPNVNYQGINTTSVPLIHVFRGGKSSNQQEPFIEALNIFPSNKIIIKYMNVTDVKDLNWSPAQLVEWLLSCDVHFIIAHVHQGLEPLNWNMLELQEQLSRLFFHNGFPNNLQLKCPIFTQDKYEYLSAVKQITNNTLKIEFTASGSYSHYAADIQRCCFVY